MDTRCVGNVHYRRGVYYVDIMSMENVHWIPGVLETKIIDEEGIVWLLCVCGKRTLLIRSVLCLNYISTILIGHNLYYE